MKLNGLEKFICDNCGKEVDSSQLTGTKQRNHCPFCLYSKHVDLNFSGDRKANCDGKMKPIALTFKEEGMNKYGQKKQGELMLIHACFKCGKISVNRIAADDNPDQLLSVFKRSQEIKTPIEGVTILVKEDLGEIKKQLFGKVV